MYIKEGNGSLAITSIGIVGKTKSTGTADLTRATRPARNNLVLKMFFLSVNSGSDPLEKLFIAFIDTNFTPEYVPRLLRHKGDWQVSQMPLNN